MALRKFTIPATCPHNDSHRESCCQCLRDRLLANRGIKNVTFRCAESARQPMIELDYDPRLITLTELEQEVGRAGICLSPERAQLVLPLEGMVSPRSEQAVEAALAKLPGVAASASFASRSLRIEFDRKQCALPEIVRRLDHLGLRLAQGNGHAAARPTDMPSVISPPTPVPSRAWEFWHEYQKLILAFIGGTFLLAAWVVHVREGNQALRATLVTIAFVTGGWYTFQETVRTLRQLHFDIDVLMFAAAFGAVALHQYEEGAFLLFLFALGNAGEELAMDRARRAIAALAKLAPEIATVRDSAGRERIVRVEDLQISDHVIIRPFDRLPADGMVITGASAVDQAPITGESIPAEKAAGSTVFAGTINGEGMLIVAVTKLASQSTLAKIVKMVNEAQTTKSPTQVFTDRVEHWYVPLVLISTACLLVIPALAGFHALSNPTSPWRGWFYQAMAFLTGASPCALAIGTPAAVLSGIARAARGGVLVKGGVHLENLGRVTCVAFDKTGTLTRGKPELTDVIPLNGLAADDLLAIAAAVERFSTHPLAKAIVAEAQARQCPEYAAENVEQIPGKGISASVAGRMIAVGHLSMLADDCGAGVPRAASPGAPGGLPASAAAFSPQQAQNAGSAVSRAEVRGLIDRLAAEGKTTVVVSIDGQAAGVLALADRPRENAAESLRRLKALGIARTIMLTGDNVHVAQAMARQVGVDEFFADLLPENKVDLVRKLQEKYGRVAMVGDGVNDAPAMANASVGVAMGGAGTDVALETADVALMADDLAKLPEAIGLSRFSRRIIVQNLTIALGVIAILAPAAALGYTSLGLAVLFHEGSTVVVVLNSLRLLVYRPR